MFTIKSMSLGPAGIYLSLSNDTCPECEMGTGQHRMCIAMEADMFVFCTHLNNDYLALIELAELLNNLRNHLPRSRPCLGLNTSY